MTSTTKSSCSSASRVAAATFLSKRRSTMSGDMPAASTSPAVTCKSPPARKSARGKSANRSTARRHAARWRLHRRLVIPSKGRIWLKVNGDEKQTGDLSEMIWNVPEIIAKLSQQVELAAGDVILTGTPAGVSALKPGDKISCGIDGVGTLDVTIT